MKMHMIAVVYQNNIQVGYRIFDSDSGKIMDASNESIISAIKANNRIYNLEIKDGKLSGSNGAISRFAKINNGRLDGKAPIIVIKQIGSAGFVVSDYKGTTMKLKESDAISLANKFGIANGMVKDNNGTVFISSINGRYDYEDYVDSNTKSAPSPEQTKSAPSPEQTKSAPSPEQTSQEAKENVKLHFNNEQMSVLKKYYAWAMLDEETADKEISILDNKVAKKSGLTNSIFLDIVCTLGSVYRITNAFGNDLGTHIISFMMVGLDFPESMLITASGTARLDTQAFFKHVFPNFEEAISNIYINLDSMFFVATKNILDYILDYEILGEYKPFLDKNTADKIEESKRYTLIRDINIPSVRLLLGVIDIAKEFTAELEAAINNRWNNCNNSLYAYALLYYCNSLEFCPLYSNDTDGIKCYNYEKLNATNRKNRKTRLRRAIYEVIGLYKRYYTYENVKGIFKIDVDRVVSTDKEGFDGCRFIGTPIDYKCSALPEEKSIYHMYDLVKCLVGDNDILISDFREFRSTIQRYIDSVALADLQKRQLERNNSTDKEMTGSIAINGNKTPVQEVKAPAQEVKAPAQEVKAPAQEVKAPAQEVKAPAQEVKTPANIVIDPNEDRTETYKKLLSASTKNHDNETSFIIAADMISRHLKYKDMSQKQKYRLDDAIKKLCEELGIQDVQNTKSISKSSDSDTNNTYFLKDHPDIKDKVKKLLDKADSVEMSTVLKDEPSVLNICYSILKRGKASDRQLKHVDSAISILENQ